MNNYNSVIFGYGKQITDATKSPNSLIAKRIAYNIDKKNKTFVVKTNTQKNYNTKII